MMNRTQNDRRRSGSQAEKAPPSHVAKIRRGTGDGATYERIGVAWEGENGAFYVRLYGTQIVSDAFNLYPIES